MDSEVIYDVECCVIKMAKLQKNNFMCEMEPPLNLKYSQLYSRFSLELDYFVT